MCPSYSNPEGLESPYLPIVVAHLGIFVSLFAQVDMLTQPCDCMFNSPALMDLLKSTLADSRIPHRIDGCQVLGNLRSISMKISLEIIKSPRLYRPVP